MIRTTTLATLANGDEVRLYLLEPEECPLCKKSIKAELLSAYVNAEHSTANVIFECRGCGSAFVKVIRNISEKRTSLDLSYEETEFSCSSLYPNMPVPVLFTSFISDTSPQFVKIFNEANAAECAGLLEIAGIGYRKAVEFLIKDYLISKANDDQEAIEIIKSKQLGQCIKDDISNPNLKNIAERAVWIGNDETHYIRKHEDRDVQDLKVLIEISVKWIEMELMTESFTNGIQPVRSR